MARSLRASKAGLEQAKLVFKRKGWTQDYLAGAAGCTRQTVYKFFARKSVEKSIFQAICTALDLDWGEIAEFDTGADKPVDIDELVQTVRKNIYDSIQQRCGTMRVLDMSQPIGLDDIYTSVNILEKITGRRRLEIAKLLQGISLENFERFSLGRVREERVPGLEAVNKYSKLMILGKPGSGKTTFLKHLAIQCIGGNWQAKRIPVFITLKDFAEAPHQPDLLDYLIQLFASYGIASETKAKTGLFTSLLNRDVPAVLPAVEQLLSQGKLLILLDGLDEVRESDSSRVLKQIQNLTTDFDRNQFLITCRIAAREYTFEKFTEVEIADFDEKQITSFANKWFQAKDDIVKAERFIERLKKDQPIKELATSPLLLTMLCLVFEESGSFPANRSELYKEGLDVLLKKWDTKRNIERDQVYKKLSLKRKEDLLSQIALETFERGDYFFKQKEVERYITQYIRNLPEANTDPEALQLDSEALLKSIEAQHGLFVERARRIYSFSHLTFHEYFTARKLVTNAADDKTLQALATHITEKRWREVLLLTVGMLESADPLLQLIKHQIDTLVEADKKLQQFLAWANQKSCSVKAPYKLAAVRAFYFQLAWSLDRDLARDVARNHSLNPNLPLDCDLALDLALIRALALVRALVRVRNLDYGLARVLIHDLARDFTLALDLSRAHDFTLDRNRALARHLACALALLLDQACDLALEPELERKLQQLKEQLPNTSTYKTWENFESWWQAKSQAWAEQLTAVMIQHRNIGHDWQFSDSQIKLLQQYYDATQLLGVCLNSDCYVSREVRQEIEETSYSLLPITEYTHTPH